jgi:hypothetical protein
MTEVRTSSPCERPCAGIEDTLETSIGTEGQPGLEAEMVPTQESGLRENCTSRLSERAEAGRKPHLSRLYNIPWHNTFEPGSSWHDATRTLAAQTGNTPMPADDCPNAGVDSGDG